LAKSLWPSRFAKVALPKLLCPSHLGECAHPVPRQASRGTPLWDRSDQVSAMPSTRQPMIASTSAHQDGVGSGDLPQAGSADPSIAPAWVAGGANATSASSAHRTCKPSPLSAVLAAELLRARREHAPRRAASPLTPKAGWRARRGARPRSPRPPGGPPPLCRGGQASGAVLGANEQRGGRLGRQTYRGARRGRGPSPSPPRGAPSLGCPSVNPYLGAKWVLGCGCSAPAATRGELDADLCPAAP